MPQTKPVSLSSAGQPRPVSPLNSGRKTRKEKHSQCLSIAAWNVRTLLDRKKNNSSPERRTAIVAMELERYGIGVAALSETRFAGDGKLTENNYTLMTLRVKLVEFRQATMISAYAPTLDATDEDKDMFYAQLYYTILTAIHESDKVFLIGDIDARVGRSADVWKE